MRGLDLPLSAAIHEHHAALGLNDDDDDEKEGGGEVVVVVVADEALGGEGRQEGGPGCLKLQRGRSGERGECG